MVGPGTGLAPFRSFILQRHLQAQRGGSTCGPMVLYFGCRRSDQDFLYGKVGHMQVWLHGGCKALVLVQAVSCGYADHLPLCCRKPECIMRSCTIYTPPALAQSAAEHSSVRSWPAQELQAWHTEGVITLHAAFSRMPGQPKVYVQQRLRESAQQVWQLLQAGGHFYVCGDANSMAGAVEQTLLDIIGQHQAQGPEAARQYLEQLSAQERYQRDVWFA